VKDAKDPGLSGEWLALTTEWAEAEAAWRAAAPGSEEAARAYERLCELKAGMKSVVTRGAKRRTPPGDELVIGLVPTGPGQESVQRPAIARTSPKRRKTSRT
jgi:hypothetical protein